MISRYARFLGVGVLMLAVLFSVFLYEQKRSIHSENEVAQGESHWASRIGAVGPRHAYEEFAQAVSDLDRGKQHTSAHVFGAALYEVEGISGLSVCDTRFSYGCFHEFLGRAIAEHGLASVSELNDGCISALAESPLSCQHGIGHGVMAYFGYREEDLLRALGVCEDLPYNDPIGGCYGGVFMEYNFRTMLGTEGRIREFEGDVHEPCNRLRDLYKPPCAYWQPQWWQQMIFSGSADAEVYERMGEYCRDMGELGGLLRSCMEGLGTITSQVSGYDPEKAALLCDSAASGDPRLRLFCTALAANSFGIEVGKEAAERACARLEGEEGQYCLAYAHNEANILNILPEP